MDCLAFVFVNSQGSNCKHLLLTLSRSNTSGEKSKLLGVAGLHLGVGVTDALRFGMFNQIVALHSCFLPTSVNTGKRMHCCQNVNVVSRYCSIRDLYLESRI